MNDQNNDSQATIIFVLGLLSIVMCQLFGPVAWMMGNSYKAQCELAGVPMNQMGQIGRILGMVGTALLMLVGLLLCAEFGIFFMLGVAGGLN